MNFKPPKGWTSAPINPICEVLICDLQGDAMAICDKVTVRAYRCEFGWMSLCEEHAQEHPEAFCVYELINRGERFL